MRVGVFDGTFRTLADFADTLDRERPPIVGIAVNLMTKRNALAMIALAKQRGARVVIGGPDPPHHAAVVPRRRRGCCGDRRGRADTRRAGRRRCSPHRSLRRGRLWMPAVEDPRHRVSRPPTAPSFARRRARYCRISIASRIPIATRSICRRYLHAWRERHGVGTVSLITARGCPYTCTWCSRSVFGETHRRRSVDERRRRSRSDRRSLSSRAALVCGRCVCDPSRRGRSPTRRSWRSGGSGCRSNASRAPSATDRLPERRENRVIAATESRRPAPMRR